MKVAIMESLAVSKEEMAKRKKPFEEKGVEFVEFAKTTDKETLVKEAKDADVMIIANMPMPGDVIEKCEKLKFIDVAFTGVDHVGLDACKSKGIKVSNASGYSNEAVSELAIGMVLSIYRNMREVEKRCRDGLTKEGLVGNEIKGKTVGIIGYGRIGGRTAELFNAFNATVIAYDPFEIKNAPEYVTQVSMEELLKISDIVVVHCPLNDSTKGMIDKSKFDLMKKSAVFVNVARGPIVNSKDLADALDNGVIKAAAIDVFDTEPPLNKDYALLTAKNTLVTPHVAFASEESMVLRAEIVFDNLQAYIDGNQKNVIL